jgi:hypothetical protein
VYDGVERLPCSADEDCDALPDGLCPPLLFTATTCYPDGTCEPATRRCHYPALSARCESDADCTELPGGRCHARITTGTCQYNGECESDADCGDDMRCACSGGDNRCIVAECHEDGDCPAGESCKATPGCAGFYLFGYHCTTPDDQCSSDDDCDTFCHYDAEASRWACHGPRCTIP